MAVIVSIGVLAFVGVAMVVQADNCPIVSESFTGVALLDAIDNSKCIYQFGKLIMPPIGSDVLQLAICRKIITSGWYEWLCGGGGCVRV